MGEIVTGSEKPQVERDYGTNCRDCERFLRVGEVCVIEHGKRFLWEYCRDFEAKVELPDYNELMKTVKQEHALQRHKEREKKDKERKQKLKEREARKEEQRRARIGRARRRYFAKLKKKKAAAEKRKREREKRREQLESARQKDSNPPAEVAIANVKDSSLKSETQKSKKKPIDDVIIQQAEKPLKVKTQSKKSSTSEEREKKEQTSSDLSLEIPVAKEVPKSLKKARFRGNRSKDANSQLVS